MGSLDWGAGGRGALVWNEKLRLLGNLILVKAADSWDRVTETLGLLRPEWTDTEVLLPPMNALTADALALAEETHAPALLAHSWRTYLFGALLARHERIDFDPSLFFAAAILHDLGLTESHKPELCQACFALSGGERVRDHLHSRGHSQATARKIGDAISLHLNGRVSRYRHGAEAHLVSRGANCDLFGAGRRRISRVNLIEIHELHPRDGVLDALRFESARHLRHTRAQVMTALSKGKRLPEPFADIVLPGTVTSRSNPSAQPR
ncbi:HD domain-containing protein [Paracoccus xiamenensis]|uniref:HD domain-containing protein n=1 Tax=Paracoccus xiamenensis TaxID=2714901 RepID=UPI00140CC7BE|nr:HD domain-containing protein [Paracoccus xiamenensis]NHF72587.1 HD domain-containing protein [Paracoccus xiamenensis]